jgi:hypothetical protein
MLPCLGDVGHIIHLGVIGHKPVQNAEGDVSLVLQDVAEESQAVRGVKRF